MSAEEKVPVRDDGASGSPLTTARLPRMRGGRRNCAAAASCSEPLLGVVILEEFGLAADPVNRRLIPVPGLLK